MSANPYFRGRPRWAIAAPRVYLAGKIAKNDWRHELVPGLRGAGHEDGPMDCEAFAYVGPFFEACDHGCRHVPGAHGAAGAGCVGPMITRGEVHRRNEAALESAHIVWAYIEDLSCYGTLFELGYAARAGKGLFLGFAPGIDHDELWYAARAAIGAPAVRIIAREDMAAVFRADLELWRRS